jgi:hypothetical protein
MDFRKKRPVKGDESVSVHGGKFIPARDSRNRRVRGLSVRNGRYYGLLWTGGEDGGKKTSRRFPLSDESGETCTTLAHAKEAFERLRGSRRENTLPSGGRKPGFTAWADTYLARAGTLAKKAGTVENERQA